MTNTEFYTLVDSELDQILVQLEKNCNLLPKKEEQRKSYALLVWILKFYGLTNNYIEYITDGSDDSSCDIVFNRKTKADEEVYYIIQSKWNKSTNVGSKFDSKDIKQSINDFETIIAGKKTKSQNLKFDAKCTDLVAHLNKNGRAKFLFIGLCNDAEKTHDNVEAFRTKYKPKISFDILDINQKKSQYIESAFKEVVVDNPLDFEYRPEDVPITIQIERFSHNYQDVLALSQDKKAFIFLIKPKVIFELFEKFGFQIFYKNVRNPLPKSNYNEKIADTLKSQPHLFWFFNNGITGITETSIDIGVHAKEIVLGNLQIINGAQTVYTIYNSYKDASTDQRTEMDKKALISFRLIVSKDTPLNNCITQFTNSQNPLLPSDFYANDEIQERLQKESYAYNLWYEKRRGEFRSKPENITVVDKDTMAAIYLACHLEEPILANRQRDLHFVSKLHDKDGLYEFIFSDKTTYADMIASFRLFKINIISTYSKPGIDFPPDDRNLMPFLTLSKKVLGRCLANKFNDSAFKLNNYINKHHEDAVFRDQHLLTRTFVTKQVFNKYFLDIDSLTSQQNFNDFYSNRDFFGNIKQWFDGMELSFEKVEEYNATVKEGSLPIKAKS